MHRIARYLAVPSGTVLQLLLLSMVWTPLDPQEARASHVPQLISFQGVLKDSTSAPVADGSYTLTFKIYSTAVGGIALWTESQLLSTSHGLFTALLGAATPGGVPDFVFADTSRYLGIAVTPDPEMSPRQRLAAVPYAYESLAWGLAGNAGTAAGTNYLGTTDDQALDVRVNGNRALRIEPTSFTANLIGGSVANNASPGVHSATIGGGGDGGIPNRVTDIIGTVSGGSDNRAGDDAGTVFDREAATVGGGESNVAAGSWSTVSGGFRDTAGGDYAVISGGDGNVANALLTTIGGGRLNYAAGSYSTVSGGYHNAASGQAATMAGGSFNRALGDYSVVAGGGSGNPADSNAAAGDYSAIGGGRINVATGAAATIAGGQGNSASGFTGAIGGGVSNSIVNATSATIGGGGLNIALGSGEGPTIGGGISDTAAAAYATVPGGYGNRAAGQYSSAAGRRAKALHDGSFVWADHTDADFASTAADQFLVRATGGVGIGTNSPQQMLDIENPNPAGNSVLRTNRASTTVAGGVTLATAGVDKWSLRHPPTGTDNLIVFNHNLTAAAMVFDVATNNVGIGTTAPAATLHVNGTAGNNTGVWSNLSDRRLKKEIEPLDHALKTVEQLRPVTFRWKDPAKDAQFGRVRGLIAQDVEKVIPEWIKTDPDGYKRIEPVGVDALLIEAVKELINENEALKSRVAALEANQRRAGVEP